MHLTVLLPERILVDTEVTKVIAEGQEGSFCLLPRHIDVVSALVPGILSYWPDEATEMFLAVDVGTLVKCADHVRVSTRKAVGGDELETLRAVVEQRFRALDERERSSRAALARLEAGVMRRFIELEHHGHE